MLKDRCMECLKAGETCASCHDKERQEAADDWFGKVFEPPYPPCTSCNRKFYPGTLFEGKCSYCQAPQKAAISKSVVSANCVICGLKLETGNVFLTDTGLKCSDCYSPKQPEIKQEDFDIKSLVEIYEERKEYVKCDRCKDKLNVADEQFFTILGNINVGLYGGIVGNNLDRDHKVGRASVICFPCFDMTISETKKLLKKE